MFGVTVENNDFGKIAKLGYRIVENSTDGFSTETEIISEDEIIHAKISLCGKDGLLHLVIEDEEINYGNHYGFSFNRSGTGLRKSYQCSGGGTDVLPVLVSG